MTSTKFEDKIKFALAMTIIQEKKRRQLQLPSGCDTIVRKVRKFFLGLLVEVRIHPFEKWLDST
jgi:hypothetical protein